MPGNNDTAVRTNELRNRFRQLQTFANVALSGGALSRAQLASKLGIQYGGDRNLYEALGWPLTIDYGDYLAKFERHALARAVIDRPVNATWRGGVTLLESDNAKDTELEKRWEELDKELSLASNFARVDRLSGIGQYGILLLGFDDTPTKESFSNPVTAGNRKLHYIKPLGEISAEIKKSVTDPSDERYGLPEIYGVTLKDENTNSTQEIGVYHTRVIHIASGLLESEVLGTPRLQAVYNQLQDIEKIVGGSAEMYWRGARPGYQGIVDEDAQMTEEMLDELETQIKEYEDNLRRMLINEGIEFKALATQVSDPKPSFDVQVQMISAYTGIPKRILTGTERGELASTQDSEAWLSFIEARREDFAEPIIVRPFADRCIEYGVLPKPKDDYSPQWQDLFALGEKEQADVGLVRAKSLQAYGSAGAGQDVMPVEGFYKYILNLDEEAVEFLEELREKAMEEEEDDMKVAEEEARRIAEEQARQQQVIAQANVDITDWKKIYEDGGAHWTEDLQPSKLAQEFAQELVDAHKQTILEIGCGNGRDSILFAYAGLRVTSIDIVPEAIELAKENASFVEQSVDFQVGDAEDLDFEDVSFDAVFSMSVLHATDIEKSISEIARVLRHNGRALIFIYSDVETIGGDKTEFVNMNEFIDLLKTNDLLIQDIYTTADDEFDEAGEKHNIIVARISK